MVRDSNKPINRPIIGSVLGVLGVPVGWLLVLLSLYLPGSAKTCVIIAVAAASAGVVAAFLSRSALWIKCISVGIFVGALLATTLALTWSTIPG